MTIPQFGFILPDDRTKLAMRLVERTFKDLTERQSEYAWHCVKSWGFGQGSYARTFLPAMMRAAKKARNNLP